MNPLSTLEKIELQKNWTAWALDLINRRFDNEDKHLKYAVFVPEAKPKILYTIDGVKERLIYYVTTEGYGK